MSKSFNLLGPSLKEDLHVHSTFSDGANSMEENIEAALERGLTRICCVDHVRRDTPWVPDFVAKVRELQKRYAGHITINCGVEAKFLDARGTLDLPQNIDGVDYIFAADHQVPLAGGILHPRDVTAGLQSGLLTPEQIIRDLTSATLGAMFHSHPVVIAHLFSILPKIGLSERAVPVWALHVLAAAATRSGSIIEISERWTCPGPAAIWILAQFGVELRCSTDAHSAEAIGRYDWVADQLDRTDVADSIPGALAV
ncbi:MAG: PHP domain-containing protein [Rhodothermales bacterium]|nr:PHP domain-containing protein [Rhodothermales bacterium]